MPSTASSSPMPNGQPRRTHQTRSRRAWEGTAGRLKNPARSTPAPAHRHFGSATSRTREADATSPQASQEEPGAKVPSDHGLTTKGSRNDARSQ